jgi:glycosyltransferase involved in cell wall biosynthesis
VANGCTDATQAEAEAMRAVPGAWPLTVLDLPEGGKTRALGAGEAVARGAVLAYLDADVIVSRDLMAALAARLDTAAPAYGSGQVVIPDPASRVSRLYARFYRAVPFFHTGVPRHLVAAPYRWPVVEGWAALVRVRRRQDAGVAEIAARHPALLANDDPRPGARARLVRAALAHPLACLTYAAVRVAARLRPAKGWARGR